MSLVSWAAFHPPWMTYPKGWSELRFAPRGKHPVPMLVLHPVVFGENCAVFIFSHGNAEDLGYLHEKMSGFAARHSCIVVAYEYDGYGCTKQEGLQCSEDGCYSCARACYDYVTGTMGIATQRIVLCGHSLGSGPTVHLAREVSPAGYGACILLSPLLSCLAVPARCCALLSCVIGDMFDNAAKIHRVTQPLLIIHGSDDAVISSRHSTALHALAPHSSLHIIQGAGHNNLFSAEHGLEVHAFIEFFLKRTRLSSA